jgi:hypothetical protein
MKNFFLQVRQEPPFACHVEVPKASCDTLFVKIATRGGPPNPDAALSLQPLPAKIALDLVPQVKRNGELMWRAEVRPLNEEDLARRDQLVMETTGVPCEQGPVIDSAAPDKDVGRHQIKLTTGYTQVVLHVWIHRQHFTSRGRRRVASSV